MHLFKGKSARNSLVIESKDNIVEIPIDKFCEGEWRVLLDWEYDGQIFTHQKDFEIKNPDRVL